MLPDRITFLAIYIGAETGYNSGYNFITDGDNIIIIYRRVGLTNTFPTSYYYKIRTKTPRNIQGVKEKE